MYQSFYGFETIPFLLTPDSRFFFGSAGHSRAIAHLVYGLAQQEGFVVITGDVGAGKTTLVEQLRTQLDPAAYALARVVTTQVNGDDLLRLALADFGVDAESGIDKATLLRRFETLVRTCQAAGRRCVLVVDEVQALSLAALEELRMLSNVTADGRACLQIVLLGQPQFRPTLARADLEQLRQRVLASYHLGPLDAAETRRYVEHRLRVAGWRDDPAWDAAAFDALHRHTGGIPRRINTLCGRVLLYGALEEAHRITEAMVDLAAGELAQDLGLGGVEETAPETASALQRIAALEDAVARHDRIMRRLLDLLNAMQERP